MLETLILLAIFTTLVVVGVHSVTRNDKLLWFLGVRIHARDKALDLQDQMTERMDAAFDRFESKIDAKTKEMQDIANAIDEKGALKSEKEIEDLKAYEFADISENYDVEKALIENFFGQQIKALQSRAERLECNRFIKILLLFAPALTECLTCMASFWGTIIFSLYFSGILSMSFFFVPIAMPFFLLSVAGLNTAIGKIIA
jgi:RNA binding exosome subunit